MIYAGVRCVNCGVDEDEGDYGVLAFEEREKGGLRIEMEEREEEVKGGE